MSVFEFVMAMTKIVPKYLFVINILIINHMEIICIQEIVHLLEISLKLICCFDNLRIKDSKKNDYYEVDNNFYCLSLLNKLKYLIILF